MDWELAMSDTPVSSPTEYLVRRTKQDGTVTLEMSASTTHNLGDDITMEVFSVDLVGVASKNL